MHVRGEQRCSPLFVFAFYSSLCYIVDCLNAACTVPGCRADIRRHILRGVSSVGKRKKKKQPNNKTNRSANQAVNQVSEQVSNQADQSGEYMRLERSYMTEELSKELFRREPFRVVTVFRAILLLTMLAYGAAMIAATAAGILANGIIFSTPAIFLFDIISVLMLLEIFYPGNKNLAGIVIIIGALNITTLPFAAVFYLLSIKYSDPPMPPLILAAIASWYFFFRVGYKWSEERRLQGHSMKELEEKINNFWKRRK